MRYEVRVNGQRHRVETEPDTPLLWVLRDEVGLTGTKYGCGVAQCGACTVFVGGRTMRSCVLPIAKLGDRELVTIEGVDGREATAVQEAWRALDVPQCGFCQSGQILSATALLRRIPQPTDDDVDAAMTGNVCRCATYVRVRAAIHQAARALAAGEPPADEQFAGEGDRSDG